MYFARREAPPSGRRRRPERSVYSQGRAFFWVGFGTKTRSDGIRGRPGCRAGRILGRMGFWAGREETRNKKQETGNKFGREACLRETSPQGVE